MNKTRIRVSILFLSCVTVFFWVQLLMTSEIYVSRYSDRKENGVSEYLFSAQGLLPDQFQKMIEAYPEDLPDYSDVVIGIKSLKVGYGDNEQDHFIQGVFSFYPKPGENRFSDQKEIPTENDFLILNGLVNGMIPYKNGEVGSLQIYDKTNQYVIRHSSVNSVYLPVGVFFRAVLKFETFKDCKIPADTLLISTYRKLTVSEERKLKTYVNSFVNVHEFERLETESEQNEKMNQGIREIILIIIGLCFLSCSGIVRFLYMVKRKEYSVFRMCGAKKSTIIFIFIRAVLLIATSGIALASTLFCAMNLLGIVIDRRTLDICFYGGNAILLLVETTLIAFAVVCIELRKQGEVILGELD